MQGFDMWMWRCILRSEMDIHRNTNESGVQAIVPYTKPLMTSKDLTVQDILDGGIILA
jgi:hypothetical protein